jgi:hypothetical protein
MSEYLVLLLLNANVDIHFNAHTKSKIGNPNNLNSLEAKTPKGLNRMANICPRGENLSFNNKKYNTRNLSKLQLKIVKRCKKLHY